MARSLGVRAAEDLHSKRRRRTDNRGDYRITEAGDLESGGRVTKYNRNVAAIKLLRRIESENRPATSDEQKVLVKYSGWGGIPEAFNTSQYLQKNKNWLDRAVKLEELLEDEE